MSGDLEVRNRQVLAIAGAVKENKGLVDLDLSHGFGVNDEMLGAIYDYLEAHPTLEVLTTLASSCTNAVQDEEMNDEFWDGNYKQASIHDRTA
jgi:hypothetical protein